MRQWSNECCVGFVTALAVAGCGSSNSADKQITAADKTVDSAQVEQGIKESLSTSSVKVTNATCPDDVKSEAGAKFTCSVKFSNGATGKAVVTETGLSKFSYALKPGSVQVPGATADAAVEKSLAAQGIPNATVQCPQNIIVKVGTTVTCNVSSASGIASGQVTFTFSDDEGTLDPASVKTA
jgi:hypothetical protein